MRIVIFCHPEFINSQSMPLFADMIFQGMTDRGHDVECWKPSPFFCLLPSPLALKKWLGYIDQYILFPLQVPRRLKRMAEKTVFVFADQALGPWVPLVANYPHVIHCHDFMALRSALGHFPQNSVSFSGRCYQALIRWGFAHGRHFISVSDNTRQDLEGFLSKKPMLSTRVYNGLNFPYAPLPSSEAIAILTEQGWQVPDDGFLVHVGGNQWYKNREGVLHIYHSYCEKVSKPLPLCLIGSPLTPALKSLVKELPEGACVEARSGMPTTAIQAAYSLAKALIFPSISEGFGWPIAEAMACGCPVITTRVAPMTEVGGDAAVYIPPRPVSDSVTTWRNEAANLLLALLNESDHAKDTRRRRGIERVEGYFNTERALGDYEAIYEKILGEANEKKS